MGTDSRRFYCDTYTADLEIKLYISGEIIPAHRLVLASGSDYFEEKSDEWTNPVGS
jgi:hypothetical protein